MDPTFEGVREGMARLDPSVSSVRLDDKIKDGARRYYVSGPSSFYDGTLLQRSWATAIAARAGFEVSFEMDDSTSGDKGAELPPDKKG